MRKDIVFPQVKGVSVAVVRKVNELNVNEWFVYLINKNNYILENVIVVSKGYGYENDEKRLTSTLRHGLGDVLEHSNVLIEPIDPSVFHLNNQYWVSYYIGGLVYDKKFIFVPESIVDQNLTLIPQLNLLGVLHD